MKNVIGEQNKLHRQGSRHRSPLRVEQAAEYLGVTVRYVRRLIAERRIDYYKPGGIVLIAPDVLDEFLEASRVAAVSHHDVPRSRPSGGGVAQ